MLSPILVTPPVEPSAVPLDELKQQLRVDYDDDDALIDALGIAATQLLDGWKGILGGRCLVAQTWSESFDRFPCGESYGRDDAMENVLRLRLKPVISVASVKYYDSAGVLQTVSGSAYRLLTDARGSFVASVPGGTPIWPPSGQCRPDAVTVQYVAGYETAADVPEPLRQAIKLMVAHWYENREAVVIGPAVNELPFGAQALIAPYRTFHLG